MYQSLELFQTAGQAARHAGAQQAVVTRNIANADTPGYRATQPVSFGEVYRADPPPRLRQSRPGHLAPDPYQQSTPRNLASQAEPAPNGNNVSLEEQMLSSVAVAREHNRALAVYRHSMTILRTALGRG